MPNGLSQKLRLFCLLSATIACSTLPANAKDKDLTPPGYWESLPERILQFPAAALGEYKIYRIIHYQGSRVLTEESHGAAKGVLKVPAQRILTIKIFISGTQRLECLDQMPANAIQNLDLRDSELKDEDLKHVGKLTELTRLDLSDTDVTDAGVKDIVKIKNLYILTIHGTDISAVGLNQLRSLPHLIELNIAGDHKVDDRAAAMIAKMTRLQGLDVSLTSIKDAGIADIVNNLTELRTLKTDRLRFGDDAIKNLAGIKHLHKLAMTTSKITDASVPVIKQLKELELLDVTGTQISPKGFAQLHAALPNCKISKEQDMIPALR